jgi:hypothetical protein
MIRVAHKKHSTVVLLSSLIISTGILVYTFSKRTTKKSSRLSSVVFSGLNGWGYDILVDDSVFIHQESIPAIGNRKGFPEKEQAEKAARLVLKKLENNEGLPTLSRFELEEICPSLKQHGQ